MTENEVPTWLKVLQNGALGEARAKAFLIDRFWILERSIDIDGADFIIQRRVTRQNLLDRDPPRLGVVQVKFYESENTTHYIPKEYILDEENNPRDEFFVLCHSGNEESPKIYFLTAKMIQEDFIEANKNGTEQFRVSGTKVLKNEKYLVKSNKNTLDRIENQLKLADFIKNRRFISWQLPSVQFDSSAILPDFKEPIDNWWGDIPTGFKKLKEAAYSSMMNVEEIYDKLKAITEEINPINALEHVLDIRYSCRGGDGRWGISLPDDLYNPEFERVCRQHLEIVNLLRNDGLLDNFIGIKHILKTNISDFICSKLPIDSNTVHSIFIEFSINDFSIKSLSHKLTRADEYWSIPYILNKYGHIDVPNYKGINEVSLGSFEYYWLPGRIWIDDMYKNDIQTFYRVNDFGIYYECMEKMFNDKY